MGGGASKSVESREVGDTTELASVTPLESTSPKASHQKAFERNRMLSIDATAQVIEDIDEDVQSPASQTTNGEHASDEVDSSDAHTLAFRWKKGELLGSGSFGSVYLARNETTGDLMAVKEISYVDETIEEVNSLQQEVRLLRSLSHTNIVKYIGSEFDASTKMLYLFTEWVPGGSLEENTKIFGCSESVAQTYLSQILLGVQYLHSRHVIHYDIKPSNILIDQHGTVKLADFGASRLLCASSIAKSKSMRGTPYYMAPEVIKQESHDTKADIWSVGCTLLKMLTGVPLWKDKKFQTQVALFFHIANLTAPPELPVTLSELATSFLLACLQINPDDRWSADQLLRHPFIMQRSHMQTAPTRNKHRRRRVLTIDLEDTKGGENDDMPISPPRVCKTAFNGPQMNEPPLLVTCLPATSYGMSVHPEPRTQTRDKEHHLPPAQKDSQLDDRGQDLPPVRKISSSPKLPHLTPPKKRSDPSVPSHEILPVAPGKTTEAVQSHDANDEHRRHSLENPKKEECERRRRSSTTDESMPRLRPKELRSHAHEVTSEDNERSPSHRPTTAVFDDTPILTDAAKRERDKALEREEQKRQIKEIKAKQWKEEQEAYRQSLQTTMDP